MRVSICITWIVAVISICVFTTLASFGSFMAEEPTAQTKVAVHSELPRAAKLHRGRCNPARPSCHLSRHKAHHRASA
jgi:hypothetical protein